MTDKNSPHKSRPDRSRIGAHRPQPELPPYRKLAELNEQELAERQELVAFITTLSRAILQNSYYQAEHPAARRVVQETYALLTRLGKRWQEFTIIKATWIDEKAVALEGVFNEAIGLEDLVGGTAGEHFSKKLHTFAERNRLISFSVKNTIGADEFHRFITVFVERHVDMEATRLMESYDDGRSGPNFTDQLLEANVVNVSVVLESDLIQEKRRLPWRVKVALARLKKDLRNIPLYSQATDMELRDAKLRLLRDIMRPLRRGLYLKQLFLNLDLISDQVAEFGGLDMEPDLMAALPLSRLLQLGQALMVEKERLIRPSLEDAAAIREDLEPTIDRQLRLIAGELSEQTDAEGVLELLREIFEAKLVELRLLPEAMREQIRMDRWTASFLVDSDEFLRLFDSIESAPAYLTQLPNLVAIFPNLLRVKKYAEARKINQMLERHRTLPGGFAGREGLVEQALRRLDGDAVFRHLGHALMTEPPDVREYIRELFVQMGLASIAPLVRVLDSTTRQDVAGEAALTLVALGSRAAEPLRDVLKQRHIKRVTARFIIKVLGELGDVGATDIIHQYTRHPHPLVRDAAIEGLVRIHGDKTEPLLVRMLSDESAELVTRAIRFLIRMGSTHKAYQFRLLQFIGAAGVEGQEAVEAPMAVQIAAVGALARLGNCDFGALGTLEDVLISALDRIQGGRVLGILNRGRATSDDALKIAICEALVQIGTANAVDRLLTTSYEPSPLVRQRMERAAAELERRISAG